MAPSADLYDSIGRTYARTRRPDPRIAGAILAALGDATTVANIGAGAGSYEPAQTVVAVEPSAVMVAQRPAGAVPVVRAVAEAIPLPDDAVDAALAVLTVHHWASATAGLAELTRIARRRIVILIWDVDLVARYWLLAEYLPEAAAVDRAMAVPLPMITAALPGARVLPVPIPHDCTDGFGAAHWRRPEAYLDPEVRAGMSMLAKAGEDALRPGLTRLASDLDSGEWARRHADLLGRDEVDVGYRLVVADL